MNLDHPPDDEVAHAVAWLQNAKRVAVFSGAGISAASGISTFRDEAGFWQRFPPDQFASWKGLLQTALLRPAELAEFFIAILEPIAAAKPNTAHHAVADMSHYKTVSVLTQNIDRLHQDAGSENVYEVHGSLFEIISFPGGEVLRKVTREELNVVVERLQESKEQVWQTAKLLKAVEPLFGFNWSCMHRPNIVLFGDQLAEPAWSRSEAAARECDLMIAIGTSQSVFPAAGLPVIAKENGAKVIVIDPESGGGDLWFAEKSEVLLPRLVKLAFEDGAANAP